MNTSDGLQLSGKFRPTDDEQREMISESDFENAEVYLARTDLDDLSYTQRCIDESDVNISTVHTPHVTADETEYLKKADELAVKNDSYLVFDSISIPLNNISFVEDDIDFEADYGYENPAGGSRRHLESTIIEPGHDLVLDTAHLFCAHENYLEEMEDILENYSDRIGTIHFCDSVRDKDGLPLGEGEMDIETTYNKIVESDYEGSLVLEVPEIHQEEALQKCREYNDI